MLSELLGALIENQGEENVLTSAISDEIVVYQYTGRSTGTDEIQFEP